jgi:hypothetical protein
MVLGMFSTFPSLSLTAASNILSDGDFKYSTPGNGTAKLESCISTSTSVLIPKNFGVIALGVSGLEGFPITSITEGAFNNCYNLENISAVKTSLCFTSDMGF